jgi:predicted N-acetyltransferase YhbS
LSGYSRPRPLEPSDDLSKFDSGEPALDDFRRRRALLNDRTGASRTFVTLSGGRVVGYYTLSTGSVERADLPTARFRKNQPDPIPVLLLGRLAVDQTHQGSGLGSQLLRDAIVRAVSVSGQVGVWAILVHALHNKARDFYLRYDFEPSPTDELHLFMLIQDARDLVDHVTL